MSQSPLEKSVIAAVKKNPTLGPKAVIEKAKLDCSVPKFTAIVKAARLAGLLPNKAEEALKPKKTSTGLIKTTTTPTESQISQQPTRATYSGKDLNYFVRKNGRLIQAEPLKEGDAIPFISIGGKPFRKEDFIEFLQKSLPEVQFGFPQEIEKIDFADLTLETFGL